MSNRWRSMRKPESKKQESIPLKVKKIHPDAKLPTRGTGRSAGLDLYAVEDVKLYPGDIRPVRTGIAMEIPEGCWGVLATRSSHGSIGVRLSAGMNVDDEDYRGEVLIFLTNDGQYPYEVKAGDRVAQVVITDWVKCDPVWADELSKTERGTGGFGSTGR